MPVRGLVIFGVIFFMIQSIKISNNTFDKIQGKIYTEVNGKQCQVKTKFSLNDVYMEIERFKNKVK
jgi:hypothetical protein